MKNKFAGNCSRCGAKIEIGAGEVNRGDVGWVLTCGTACQEQSPAARSPGASAQVQSKPESYTLLDGHEASPYQAAVFEHFRCGRDSAIVKAVAGAGKTTTIKNAVRYLQPWMHVQLYAFNTEAAGQLKEAITELEGKGELNPRHHVRAGTFHSMGFGAIRRYLNVSADALKARIDDGKVRKLLKQQLGTSPEGKETYERYGSFVSQLVGYAKGEGVGALCPDIEERWYALVEHHGMYLDSETATIERAVALSRQALSWSNEAAKTGGPIDFDDLLYLTILWKLRLWQNHVVVCDEAQDTNPVRRAMLRLSLRQGGRLYAVGDQKQAIYGFTGATADAMDTIASEFSARELPLTVSYRCASRVVERAQTWVPYIESHEDAPEGEVLDNVPLHQALGILGPKDAILCRQTAPLVELAYGLIARGRACRIMGREIGEGLVALVEQQGRVGIDRLITKLEAWRDREMARFIAKGDERRAEAVADRVNCLLVITNALPESGRTVPALVEKIRSLFADTDRGVLTLATIHKAKGQEWERVMILRPELMPSRAARQEWQYEQELNLCYVAATRAKHELIYCISEDMKIDREDA